MNRSSLHFPRSCSINSNGYELRGSRLENFLFNWLTMPDFATVDEQLAILLRGAAQVETVAELKRKLETSRATE